MIWDMETKKAWDPLTYIAYVVSQAHSWGRTTLRDGTTRFCRSSLQLGGSEHAPLNLWSIVLLTGAPDPRYYEPFEQMVCAGLLPGFLEIYIERDLKLGLSRI
jgi:hypothetical protein